VEHSQAAVRLLAAALVAVFLVAAVLDLICESRRWPGVADRLVAWTGHHPLLSAGLAATLGALMGHFFFWAPLFGE
jgi:hypothetical protein